MTTTPLTVNARAAERLRFFESELECFVGPYELDKALATGEYFLLDCRSAESFGREHIRGAVHIPRAELERRIREVPKNKIVVAYCSDITCQSSKKAAIILLKNGYEDVQVLYGGLESWKHKGFETENGAAAQTAPPAANPLRVR